MEGVEIIRFEMKPTLKQMGVLLIRYHDLHLKCQLCLAVKTGHLWIRMPEVWMTPERKTSFCHWPEKEISDMFQDEVKNQLREKHKVITEDVIALHKSMMDAKFSKKKLVKKNPAR